MVQHTVASRKVSQVITKKMDALATRIFHREMEMRPKLALHYDEFGREHYLNDIKRHLELLAKAIAQEDPSLFSDYMNWVKELLDQAGCPREDLNDLLGTYREILGAELQPEMAEIAQKYLDLGLNSKKFMLFETKSLIDPEAPFGILAQSYFTALREGNRESAIDLLLDAVDTGTSIKDIYIHVIQRVQEEVGRLWQINEITIAKEHFFTASAQVALSLLSSYFAENDKKGWSMVATCVSGELHDVGLRIITDCFEMEGWKTYYLGANMPKESILQCVKEQHTDLLAISATLPVQVPEVTAIIEAVHAECQLKNVKVLVGGYPFNNDPQLWREVGADGTAKDADEAVRVANGFVADKN